MATIYHVTEQGIAIAGPFDIWSDANDWRRQFEAGDAIEVTNDPTIPAADPYATNEPQEMTSAWVRGMATAA